MKPSKNISKENRIRKALQLGILGDAVGVPFEFMKSKVAISKLKTLNGGILTSCGAHQQKMGTWSDDTSLTLALLDSMTRMYSANDICLEQFETELCGNARAFLAEGKYTVDGVFDIGTTTAHSLLSMQPAESDYENGSGTVMRIFPLIALNILNDGKENTGLNTLAVELIHGQKIQKQLVKVMQESYYDFELAGVIDSKIFKAIVLQNIAKWIEDPKVQKTMQNIIETGRAGELEAWSAWGVLAMAMSSCIEGEMDFIKTMKCAISMGQDTDTVCAIAGQFIGFCNPDESVTDDLYNNVRRGSTANKYIDNFLNKFVK